VDVKVKLFYLFTKNLAPYNHSNIDSDELLYYVDGDFMSRKNVTSGMLTLHPGGNSAGPAPGKGEKINWLQGD
jgi:homogentisate 1,2-dioxygenase